MKVLRMREHFDVKFQEYVIGPGLTGSTGTYLVYGEVPPGEARTLGAGEGHEEVLLVIAGKGRLVAQGEERAVAAEETFYMGPDFSAVLHALGDEPVRYVSAGGHIPGGHSH